MIPLYEVPRNSTIDVRHLGLTLNGVKIKELEFKHVDGMYSLCYYRGEVIHLGASVMVNLTK